MEELRQKALELLNSDSIFEQCCEELNGWNGFLGDNKLYDMEFELDELHYCMKLSDFLERVDFEQFSLSDKYWYYDIYGKLVSYNGDKADWYRVDYSNEDVLEEFIDNYPNVDVKYIDGELNDIIKDIANYEEDDN